jgi:peptidyl-prolyl cis-trans isomerase C
MIKLNKLFLPALLLLVSCNPTTETPPIVARVNQTQITLPEFQKRLNNLLQLTSQDNYEIHEAVLQNIVNEKMLLNEARARGYDQTDEYQTLKKDHEINLLLKLLRDKIAEERVKVTEKDIQRAFALQNEQVRARILYAPTRQQAQLYYRQLQNGATFEELALDAFQDPRLAQTGGDPGYFSWEDMQLPFAEAAQALKPGEISKPVLSRSGWYVIRVTDRFSPPLSETEYRQQYKKIRWIVTHRKKAQAIRKYTDELTTDLNITFNEPVLNALMAETAQTTGDNFRDFGLREDQVIATAADKDRTLADFYNKAQWTSLRQRNSVKDVAGLKRFIEGLAVREVLLKQAEEAGIRKTTAFNSQLKQQLDLYLIEKMNHEIMDSVRITEQEARDYYEKFSDQFIFQRQVNVREILVKSKNEAEKLLEKIRSGEDFSMLAQKYSLRKWAAKQGGELGLCPKTQFGEHGEKIFSMKPGEIAGPLKNEDYYSIIKVIDIQEARSKTFSQARAEIDAALLHGKKQITLMNTLKRMRQEYEIEINLKKEI